MLTKPNKHTFSHITALLFSTTLLSAHAHAQGSAYTSYTPWAEESLKIERPIEKELPSTETASLYKENKKDITPQISRIEGFYASRIVDELEQYGYDLFQNKTIRPIDSPSGGVNQDSVIIGVGDTLDIILRGQINDRQDYTISPQGLLILDQFPPISVIGLSPSALQFRSEKDPSEYINEAGGFSYHADKGRSFVILPDGSAQPLRVNYWNHQASFIPPGSTIIVPRDPKPFNLVDSAKDISQIVANLAVTAVLADEIGDDD